MARRARPPAAANPPRAGRRARRSGHVIQRLVAKNPAERYRTAAEALADLRIDPSLADTLAGGGPQRREELAAEAASRKRRQRMRHPGHFAAQWPGDGGDRLLRPPDDPRRRSRPPPPVVGYRAHVLPEKHTLVIESDGKPVEYTVRAQDHLFLNGAASLLRDLQDGDRLQVKKLRHDTGAHGARDLRRPRRNAAKA